ncbi:TspO/MBR family protein [Shimia sp. SDUM112013]|uniref:TspO/MBR family protein n=1 Tax=Shimia sp. SDUM112013 TaxID=3136160 RepID=UPI0032EF0A8A
MNRFIVLLIFVVGVMATGITIGTLTAPGAWYAALQKPAFNPPNWIFAPVWTVLYLMIAFVGWRIWDMQDRGPLMRLWSLQMALNFLWSPVFFAAEMPVLALVVILALLVVIILFIRAAFHPDRLSALLFLPYLSWVGFASLLNGAIVLLNSGA